MGMEDRASISSRAQCCSTCRPRPSPPTATAASACSTPRPRACSVSRATTVLGRDLEELTRGDPARGRARRGAARDAAHRSGRRPPPDHRRTAAAGSRRWATAPRCSSDGATARVLRRPHRRPRRGAARGRGPALRRGRPHRQRHGPRAQVAARHRGALRQPAAPRRSARTPASVERLDVIKDQTRLCLDRIGAIMHSINPDIAKAGGMTLTPVGPSLRDVVGDLRRRHEDAAVTLRGAGGEPARRAGRERPALGGHQPHRQRHPGDRRRGRASTVSGERRRGHAHDRRGRPRPRAARGQRVRGLLHDQVERHRPGALARAPPGGGRRRQHHLRRTAGAAAPCSPCACRCRATSASGARASSSSRTTRRSATSRRRRSRSMARA